jgi:hypothetical protein
MKQTLQKTIGAIAQRLCADIQEGIQAGPGNNWWDLIKQGRQRFGHTVMFPVLAFDTEEEVYAFLETGELPEGMNDEVKCGFFDSSHVGEYAASLGLNINVKQLEKLIESMQPPNNEYGDWLQPIFVSITGNQIKSSDGKALYGGIGQVAEWWDTEAEVIPVPGVTKEAIRTMLTQEPTSLVVLNTRCPLQAGDNMNLWLDVCTELNLRVIVDAETTDGLRTLSPRNRAGMLPITLNP